jgi:S-adenosylmethionine:tRNA ribosyltransferase-isomerase
MKTSLFSFDLPDELIAKEPAKIRGTSRLMLLNRFSDQNETGSGKIGLEHRSMPELSEIVDSDALMVFNDTRVRKARMFGKNELTGGRGEFLFVEALESGEWDCVVDKARKKKTGQSWIFPGNIRGRITGEPAPDRRILRFDSETDETWFEEYGHIPLPPYMRRPDNPDDAERYQTVYARTTGSAAAPTAGLHFTPQIISALQDRGVEIAWVTLQVGLGTFSPVRTEMIYDHPMHSERYSIPNETADAVGEAKRQGRPVLAVGTTSVRTLEAAWDGSSLKTGEGATDLFIYPGYEFKVVNQIFTNFHTPESSLLMMISAFCGRERLLEAYRVAVEEKYRFFSYGDAMFIR